MEDQPAYEGIVKPHCSLISTEAAGAEVLPSPANGAEHLVPSGACAGPRKGCSPSPFGEAAIPAGGVQGLKTRKRPHWKADCPQEQQIPKGPSVQLLSTCAPCGANELEERNEDCVVEVEGRGSVRTPADLPGCTETDIETACRETFLFANAKAGMDMTEEEKAKIAAKIFELSKNSPFFVNEMRKKKQMEEQLAVLRRRVQLFASCGGCAEASAAARRLLQLLQQQQQRESGRVYVHLDMDMFFCAVEIRDDPSLGSQPVAVGSLSMLSTANYEARRFGVRSGMPGFIAKQLCPSLTIVRPNFEKYRAAGQTIRAVLQAYDPSLSSHSLDEASLDVTDCLKKRFSPADAAALLDPTKVTEGKTEEMKSLAAATAAMEATGRVTALVSEIRAAVTAATGLSCSAGAGSSRLVAKIASDMNKPNGQKIVEATGASPQAAAAATAAFLEPLNVRKIPGIGKHREKMLNAFDIHTCGELLQQAPLLVHLLPRITAVHLIRMALGIDGLPPELQQQHQQYHQQSVSSEETFAATNELPLLRQVVEQLAAAVAKQLKELRQEGDHITLKVKFADFSIRTISHRLAQHTDDGAVIATAAQGLLQSVMREQQLKKQATTKNNKSSSNSKGNVNGAPTWVRLLGVRCSGFRHAKARSTGLRRLDEFFSQQQQQKPPGATTAGASEDWPVDIDELDDLLSVLSQHQRETALANPAAPAERETAAPPPAVGSEAAAAPPRRMELQATATAAAPVLASTWRTRDAPEKKAEAATEPAISETNETGPLNVVAANETPKLKVAVVQSAAEQQQRSRTVDAETNSRSSQKVVITGVRFNVTPQCKQQQRRRLPSPPIHERLMHQKQRKGRQQLQLLDLLNGPSKRKRDSRNGQEENLQRNRGQRQIASETVVVEVVSD